MRGRKSISVGIAAYNSEKNIKQLILSLLRQKINGFNLDYIFVHSDKSTDNTIKIVESVKNQKIIIIDSKKRKGFAGSIETIIKHNSSDILLLLNDDIIIYDDHFLNKIVKTFNKNKLVDLASVNLVPLPPKNFFENAIKTGYLGYSNFAKYYKNGNNILTCDGKVLALSKLFLNGIVFPKDLNEVGNLDTYLYALCKEKKLQYYFISSTNVLFRCPSTISDFIKWQLRNYQNKKLTQSLFPKVLNNEYKFPRYSVLYFKIVEFLKNPLGGVTIIFMGIYCAVLSKFNKTKFNAMWDIVDTTKLVKNQL